MPPASWATDEQTKWLKARIPDFVEAQGQNATDEFFNVTYTDWFNLWELEDPTAAELEEEGGDRAAAISKKTKAMRKVHVGALTKPRRALTCGS